MHHIAQIHTVALMSGLQDPAIRHTPHTMRRQLAAPLPDLWLAAADLALSQLSKPPCPMAPPELALEPWLLPLLPTSCPGCRGCC